MFYLLLPNLFFVKPLVTVLRRVYYIQHNILYYYIMLNSFLQIYLFEINKQEQSLMYQGFALV
jgi:hypothetical protein